MEAAPDKFNMQVRLADKFSDNGMISVVVFDKRGEDWTNDIWLMSCRVLGRRVEEAILAYVSKAGKAAGAKRLIGHYVPSAKNRMAAKHYGDLAFALVDGDDERGSTWGLEIDGYQPPQLPMSINREELARVCLALRRSLLTADAKRLLRYLICWRCCRKGTRNLAGACSVPFYKLPGQVASHDGSRRGRGYGRAAFDEWPRNQIRGRLSLDL
jgi:hypothetical protein